MSEITATPAAPAPERPDSIGVRFVRACLLAFLGALVLTLRVRLPAGYRRLLARGDDLPPGFLAAFAPDAPAHAPAIALGLVGDWILRGFPNRGSRATPAPHKRRPPRTARAPPRRHVRPAPSLTPRLPVRLPFGPAAGKRTRGTQNAPRRGTRPWSN